MTAGEAPHRRSSGGIVTSDITSHAAFALHHNVLKLFAILLLVLIASFNMTYGELLEATSIETALAVLPEAIQLHRLTCSSVVGCPIEATLMRFHTDVTDCTTTSLCTSIIGIDCCQHFMITKTEIFSTQGFQLLQLCVPEVICGGFKRGRSPVWSPWSVRAVLAGLLSYMLFH